MASDEIERAWRESGLGNRVDVSAHLAFVQGYEAAVAVRVGGCEGVSDD